jgi:hypothetical protein
MSSKLKQEEQLKQVEQEITQREKEVHSKELELKDFKELMRSLVDSLENNKFQVKVYKAKIKKCEEMIESQK